MRDGDIEDGLVLQDGLTAVDQFLSQTDDQRVLVTEGATNTEGNDVYGAAHEGSNTMFVDIDGERIGSLVNTVAHEGMHLAGSGEVNATFTGLFTDIAYRANALANKGNIDNHRPAPVAIQDQAAHDQLLSGNQAVFNALDDRGELQYRQLNPTEINAIQTNTEAYAQQQGYCQGNDCSPEALKQAGTELRVEAQRRVDATYAELSDEHQGAGDFLNELGAGSAIDGSDQLLFAEDKYYDNKYTNQEHIADAELIEYVLQADNVSDELKAAVLLNIIDSSAGGFGSEQLVELLTDNDLKSQVINAQPLSSFGGQEPFQYSSIVAEAIEGDTTRLGEQIAALQSNLADANHRGTDIGVIEEGQLWNLIAVQNMLLQEGGAEAATEQLRTTFNQEATGGGAMLLVLGDELTDGSRWASVAREVREIAGTLVTSKSNELATQGLLQNGGVIDPLTGQPMLDMNQLSNGQKGTMGELFGPDTARQIMPDGERLARIPGIGETGIDDLYRVNRTDVDYVVVEYKFVGDDSTLGSTRLGNTGDGRQGSETWTLGSNRLDKSVGEMNAVQIENSILSGRVETLVVTVRPDGSSYVEVLDALGKPKLVDTSSILNTLPNGVQP